MADGDGDSTSTAGTGADGAGASAPDVAASTSQAVTSTQAPVRDAGAAYDAVMAGKSEGEVAQSFNGAKPAGQTVVAATSDNPTGKPADDASTGSIATDAGENLGLNEKQVQALKRKGVWDPDALKTMPLTNRKAFADRVGQRISEEDRKFQLDKNGKLDASGKAQPGATPEGQADGGSENPQTNTQDGSTPEQTPFAFTQASIAQAIETAVSKSLKPEEATALADTLGEDAFTAMQARERAVAHSVASAMTQTVTPIMNLLLGMVHRFEADETATAIETLRKQPGYESVAFSEDQIKALRVAAGDDIRARGQQGDRIRDAIKRVAGSVFNVDPALAARAQLAKTADPYLRSSGARPQQRLENPRPNTKAQHASLAFDLATQGKTGSEIQAELALR